MCKDEETWPIFAETQHFNATFTHLSTAFKGVISSSVSNNNNFNREHDIGLAPEVQVGTEVNFRHLVKGTTMMLLHSLLY